MPNNNPGVSIHAGFPNPATDDSLENLDLNLSLIKHPSSTFFMRLKGDEWQSYGIFDKDLVIIDRALDPRRGDILVWWGEDGFQIGKISLMPPATNMWGVVTSIIHQTRQ